MTTRRFVILGIALQGLALIIRARPAALRAEAPETQQAAGRVSRPVLERYVGDYLYPDGATFKLRLDGDTLFQEAPGRRLALAAISETLFMMGPVFTAEFVTDPAGGVTIILSDGAGVEYRLRRKGAPPAPPPAAAPAVRVPREVLERYVGTYEYISGQMQRTDLRIVVRLKGETLVREMGADAVLTPLSETRFRVGDTSLMVEFVVDEAGVTQILGSGFQQMLARLTSKRW